MSDTFLPGEQSDDCDIICPHCGWRFQAEPCDGDADEDVKERDCEECGKLFNSWAVVSITYQTAPLRKTSK